MEVKSTHRRTPKRTNAHNEDLPKGRMFGMLNANFFASHDNQPF